MAPNICLRQAMSTHLCDIPPASVIIAIIIVIIVIIIAFIVREEHMGRGTCTWGVAHGKLHVPKR